MKGIEMNTKLTLIFFIFTTVYTSKVECMLSKPVRPSDDKKQTKVLSLSPSDVVTQIQLLSCNKITDLHQNTRATDLRQYSSFRANVFKNHENWVIEISELGNQERK